VSSSQHQVKLNGQLLFLFSASQPDGEFCPLTPYGTSAPTKLKLWIRPCCQWRTFGNGWSDTFYRPRPDVHPVVQSTASKHLMCRVKIEHVKIKFRRLRHFDDWLVFRTACWWSKRVTWRLMLVLGSSASIR